MRIDLTLLVVAPLVAALTVSLPAAAEEADTASAVSGSGAALAPSNAHGLAQVHGGLSADGARIAGRVRDVEMSSGKVGAAAKVVRVAPTPRVLRKLSAERAVAAIDPQVRACALANTNASPTTFGLRVSVAPGGEVESSELASTTRVSPALLACVANAVSAARFGAPGASGASIVVPITVPGRVAVQIAVVDTTSVNVATPVVVGAKPEDAVASPNP